MNLSLALFVPRYERVCLGGDVQSPAMTGWSTGFSENEPVKRRAGSDGWSASGVKESARGAIWYRGRSGDECIGFVTALVHAW